MFYSSTLWEPINIMKSNANLNMNFENITVNPIAGALGAQIDNVDLSENLPDEIISEIYNALLAYQVIFLEIKRLIQIVKKHLQKELESQ